MLAPMKDKVENYVHIVKEEEGMEKWQPTRPELATSRCIADPLTAEPWSLPD